MGIKCVTPQQAIVDELNRFVMAKQKQIVQMLQYCGESAVRFARENGNYQDRTGNLRSSVGYLIVQDGREVAQSDFNAVSANGGEGSTTGLDYARKIAAENNKGIVLIVVAGMNYALYVERRGHDVLSGSQLEAERIYNQLIQRL